MTKPGSDNSPGLLEWGIVAFGAWIQAISYGPTMFSFTLWIAAWRKEFDVSTSAVISAIFILGIARTVASPFFGLLLDRLKLRNFIILGSGLLGLGMIAVSFTTALWQIFAIYATLLPLGIVGLGPLAAQGLVGKAFREKRGLAMGLVALGTSVGGIAVPPLAAFLLQSVGWRQTHFILGIAILALIVPVGLLLGPAIDARTLAPSASTDKPARKAGFRESLALVRQPNLFIPMMAFVLPMMSFNAVQQNLGPLSAEKGFDPQLTAMLISIFAFSGICGKIGFGAVADRFRHVLLFQIACLFQIVSILLIILGGGQTAMILSVFFLGLSSGAVMPMYGAILGARFPKDMFGTVFGIAMIANGVAIGGAPLVSLIRETGASYQIAFLVLLGLVICAALIILFLPPERKDTADGGTLSAPQRTSA